MGAVLQPNELQRVIEQQVVEGREASPVAFPEEAVMRLVDEGCTEDKDTLAAVEAGAADVEAGRYRTVSTPQDAQRLHESIMARLHARLTNIRVAGSTAPTGGRGPKRCPPPRQSAATWLRGGQAL